MPNFIKFKLDKNLSKEVIEFTLLYLNTDHPIFKKYKGFRINFDNNRVSPVVLWADAFIDSSRFSIFFDSDYMDLNCFQNENKLFYIGFNNLNKKYEYKFDKNIGDIDFWHDRITKSFKALANYGESNKI